MSSLYGGYSQSTGQPSRSGATGDIIPKGYKKGRMQNFTPEMMELFQSLFSHVDPQSFLSKLSGGDEQTFNEIEAPALKQFAGLQGGMASRFSQMGQGATKSSGFQNSMNQAAQDFASQLQSQRTGLRRDATNDLFNMSNMLLGQKPFENILSQKQQKSGGWEQMIPMVLQAASMFL